MFLDLESIYITYNISCFAYAEPALSIWDDAKLIMVNYIFSMLLNLVCQILINLIYLILSPTFASRFIKEIGI